MVNAMSQWVDFATELLKTNNFKAPPYGRANKNKPPKSPLDLYSWAALGSFLKTQNNILAKNYNDVYTEYDFDDNYRNFVKQHKLYGDTHLSDEIAAKAAEEERERQAAERERQAAADENAAAEKAAADAAYVDRSGFDWGAFAADDRGYYEESLTLSSDDIRNIIQEEYENVIKGK